MSQQQTIKLATSNYPIESHAHSVLRKYLAAIRANLDTDSSDTLNDVEIRITELLYKRDIHPGQSISLADVDAIMQQLGSAADLTDHSGSNKRSKTMALATSRVTRGFGVVLLILVLAGCGLSSYAWYQNRHTETESSTTVYHSQMTALNIHVASGTVTVHGNSDPTSTAVTIHRKITWAARKPSATQKWDKTTLSIQEKDCSMWGFLSTPVHCEIDYDITVPRTAQATITVDSGNIVVQDMTSNQTVRTDSGNITLGNITSDSIIARTDSGTIQTTHLSVSDFTAKTDSGDINSQFTTVPSKVQLNAASGNLTATLPGSVSYKVNDATSSGTKSVLVDQSPRSPYHFTAKTDSGDIVINRQ